MLGTKYFRLELLLYLIRNIFFLETTIILCMYAYFYKVGIDARFSCTPVKCSSTELQYPAIFLICTYELRYLGDELQI